MGEWVAGSMVGMEPPIEQKRMNVKVVVVGTRS
jgi:hypothetical protein